MELPTTFGKYFLTEKIATGGMAQIYLAKLIGPGGFEKQLIIKQIQSELSGRRQFVDMFVREAKTLVSLTHGNIVPIYELGVVDDTYFIAMEYIDGPTLEQLLEAHRRRKQRLSPAVACFICAEFIKGLDYAHRKGEGVVHRDLSPRNVMISRDGEVKLVDFGIAVALAEQHPHPDGDMPTGSFPYMSPEQVRGESLTGQSDIFSAGVLLWEMLTGARLFARATAAETLQAVREADIPLPSTRYADIAPALDTICTRALARDPKLRYHTAGKILTQLNRHIYSLETPVTPAHLSALVAQYCPPTGPRTTRAATEEPLPQTGLDGTAVMARPGRAHPRGKTAQPKELTFATHVQFKDVLAKATPLFPFRALPADAIVPDSVATDAHSDNTGPEPPKHTESTTPATSPNVKSSRVGLLVIVLLAAAAIAVAAAWLSQSNDATNALPSSAATDARTIPPDATVVVDARRAVPDAARVDASAAAVDARIKRTQRDARTKRRRPDAAAPPAANGSLKVIANPWSDVHARNLATGKQHQVGRASGTFQLPAGLYRISLHFKPDDRARTKTFARVTIRPGGLTTLRHDFTAEL